MADAANEDSVVEPLKYWAQNFQEVENWII